MKAAHLVKYGTPKESFELRETEQPVPKSNEVLIEVESFGINFADVMARLGLYRGAPDLPALLGYDVVGRVRLCGSDVSRLKVGDRVTALTRFGGYAEYAVAEEKVAHEVPDDLAPGVALALSTQYTTAYFLSQRMANLQPDDRVLIHAAAGGVGTALVQLALFNKCTVFGTCGSEQKMEYLKKAGVHHPINYREVDFTVAVRNVVGNEGLDVIFDPIGGKSLKKGYRLLGASGRIVSFGVSAMNQTRSIFGKIKVLAQFGIYHPLQFLSSSKGMIGVNMLEIADQNASKISSAMQSVIDLTKKGILKPYVGGSYGIEQLAEAHQFIESRKSMGKVVVNW